MLICAVFFGLLVRLYAIQVSGHEEYAGRRDRQRAGHLTVTQPPGTIYDRRKETLAVSVPVRSLWADPSAIENPEETARVLSAAFGLREEVVRRRLSNRDRQFVWIKRKLTEAEEAKAKELMGLPPFKPGKKDRRARLGFKTEFARRYPLGPLAGHVLGFRSEDPNSHEGLERLLAGLLTVPDRRVDVSLDGKRRVIGGRDIDLSSVEVVLTIDHLLQNVLEEELDAACAEFRPKWAVAIALDPRTGELLGLAGRPTFDPNAPGDAPASSRLNRAIVSPIEPGSTFKPFHIAYAMDRGRVNAETRINCENGLWKYGSRLLHDHHPYGMLSVSEVIEKSSNIGAAKIGAILMGRQMLYDSLRAFGFGTRTGVDLPAEAPGRLAPLDRWTRFYTETSVTMGHEISVTSLQLVAAMSAIANGGTLYRPYVVRRVRTSEGVLLSENGPRAVRRVLRPETSRRMVEILTRVVEQGTGKRARVDGVTVAGKTGTTQKVDPATGRYSHEKFIGSFVAFAPAEAPRLCVIVVLDEPQGKYYGGTVAAPAVARIIERGLVYVE